MTQESTLRNIIIYFIVNKERGRIDPFLLDLIWD